MFNVCNLVYFVDKALGKCAAVLSDVVQEGGGVSSDRFHDCFHRLDGQVLNM